MSFGEGNLHDEIDRLKEVNGDLCAEINRQERVIESQAELIRDMYGAWCATVDDHYARNIDGYYERMAELGIEVGE